MGSHPEKVKGNELMLEGEQETVEDTGSEENEGGLSSRENFPVPGSSRSLAVKEGALENPVVLNHLFELCPASVLAICRQFNKMWYDRSLIAWRKLPITINSNIHRLINEFNDLRDEPGNQLSTHPYRNAKFSKFEFHLNPGHFRNFWNRFGSNLHILTLYRCTFTNVEEFREVIYSSCPLLTKLSIDYFFSILEQTAFNRDDIGLQYNPHEKLTSLEIIRSPWDGTMFPLSWTELFSHFPSLSTLKIFNIPEAEFGMMTNAIKAIRRRDPTKLPFNSFQLHPTLTISHSTESRRKFATVEELRLPLTDCVIKVDPQLEQSLLRNALGYLAISVKTIILKRGRDLHQIPPWFQNFPFGFQLDNLISLESRGGLLQSFSFLKDTPKLQSFVSQTYSVPDGLSSMPIPTKPIPNSCKEELANFRLLTLTTLKLGFQLRDEDIQHLFKWIPNITELEMHLNSQQFVWVCQNWRNLRKLEISGYGGLTVETITDLKKGRKAREDGDLTFLPNIAKLQDLENLSVRPLWSSRFSVESVYHLFLYLPTLGDFSNGSYAVKRKEVDVIAYQRAIEGNALEQWIADNPRKPGDHPLEKI